MTDAKSSEASVTAEPEAVPTAEPSGETNASCKQPLIVYYRVET